MRKKGVWEQTEDEVGHFRQKTRDVVGTSGHGSLFLESPSVVEQNGRGVKRAQLHSKEWIYCPKYKQWEALKGCKQGTDIICIIDGFFLSVGKRLQSDRASELLYSLGKR